jgi:hypothetical protein
VSLPFPITLLLLLLLSLELELPLPPLPLLPRLPFLLLAHQPLKICAHCFL